MKDVLLATVLTLGIGITLLGCGVILTTTAGDVSREEARLLGDAWQYVCKVDRTFRCEDVVRPRLVLHDGVNSAFGAYGVFFPGENVIFVHRTTVDPDKQMQTVVHELTHYLQDQRGWRVSVTDSCQWEAVAFAVADKYARYLGREDLIRGPVWWKPYPGCQNYGE